MSRPPRTDGPLVSTTVRLPVALNDRLRAVARERVVGVSLLIERAIEHFLDNLPPIRPDAAVSAPPPAPEDAAHRLPAGRGADSGVPGPGHAVGDDRATKGTPPTSSPERIGGRGPGILPSPPPVPHAGGDDRGGAPDTDPVEHHPGTGGQQ